MLFGFWFNDKDSVGLFVICFVFVIQFWWFFFWGGICVTNP